MYIYIYIYIYILGIAISMAAIKETHIPSKMHMCVGQMCITNGKFLIHIPNDIFVGKCAFLGICVQEHTSLYDRSEVLNRVMTYRYSYNS